MSPPSKPDNFLSLATRGNVSEILREIAKRIDSGSVTTESFAVRLQGDTVELSATFDVTGKHDAGVPARGR